MLKQCLLVDYRCGFHPGLRARFEVLPTVKYRGILPNLSRCGLHLRVNAPSLTYRFVGT